MFSYFIFLLLLCWPAAATDFDGVLGTAVTLPTEGAHKITYNDGEIIELTTTTANAKVTLSSTASGLHLPDGIGAADSGRAHYQITITPGDAGGASYSLTSFRTRAIPFNQQLPNRLLLWWVTEANNWATVAQEQAADAGQPAVLSVGNDVVWFRFPVGGTPVEARTAILSVGEMGTGAATAALPYVCWVKRDNTPQTCSQGNYRFTHKATGEVTALRDTAPVVVYIGQQSVTSNVASVLGSRMGTYVDIVWGAGLTGETTDISYEYDTNDALWTGRTTLGPSQDFGFARQLEDGWTRAGLTSNVVHPQPAAQPTKYRIITTVTGSGRFALVAEYGEPTGVVKQGGLTSGTESQAFNDVAFAVSYGTDPATRTISGRFNNANDNTVTVTNTDQQTQQVSTTPTYIDKSNFGVAVQFNPTSATLMERFELREPTMLIQKDSLPTSLQPLGVDIRVLRATGPNQPGQPVSTTRRPNGDLLFAVHTSPATYTFGVRNSNRRTITGTPLTDPEGVEAFVQGNGDVWDISLGDVTLQEFRCTDSGQRRIWIHPSLNVAGPPTYVPLNFVRQISTTCNSFTTKIRAEWTEELLLRAATEKEPLRQDVVHWGTTVPESNEQLLWVIEATTVVNTNTEKSSTTKNAVTSLGNWALFGQRVGGSSNPSVPAPPTPPTPRSVGQTPSPSAGIPLRLFNAAPLVCPMWLVGLLCLLPWM